jgi:hypothetical protein
LPAFVILLTTSLPSYNKDTFIAEPMQENSCGSLGKLWLLAVDACLSRLCAKEEAAKDRYGVAWRLV